MSLLSERAPAVWVRDLVSLGELDEESILETLAKGYEVDEIYTYVGPVLVSINPFKTIPSLFGQQKIDQFKRNAKALFRYKPHVYALAQNAFTAMLQEQSSQSVLVSGESGSGKTEIGKAVMNYIASLSGSASLVERQIVEANPLLEAFGNAKTVRNNNSSRFGKFTKVFFNGSEITGAAVESYLLEKSRIVQQAQGDLNYHIFYYLLAGASDDLRDKLSLGSVSDYNYLCAENNHSNAPSFDDAKIQQQARLFENVCSALELFEVSNEEQLSVWSVVAAVLHIGQITFEFNKQLKRQQPTNKPLVARVAQLLGIAHPMVLEVVLTTRKMTSGGRKSTYSISNRYFVAYRSIWSLTSASESEVVEFRDALAKTLYTRLFDWLLRRINEKLDSSTGKDLFIGILDIFGFEMFANNSFEQLCINYANEKLHAQFLEFMFKVEQQTYETEGIPWAAIDVTPMGCVRAHQVQFVDNSECVALIEKPLGVFALLDEECLLPKGTDDGLLAKMENAFGSHASFACARRGRNVSQAPGFTVNHFAYPVYYNVDGFVDKNRDRLYPDLEAALKHSKAPFVRDLFAEPEAPVETVKSTRPTGVGRRTSSRALTGKKTTTLSSLFKAQLARLHETIFATQPHYIRCVKPNSEQKPDHYDRAYIAKQLRYLGLMETIRIRRAGFALRLPYAGFVARFRSLLPHASNGDAPKQQCVAILKQVDAEFAAAHSGTSDAKPYHLGKSKVFARQLTVELLDNVIQKKLEKLAICLSSAARGLLTRAAFVPKLAALREVKRQQRIALAACVQAAARALLARKAFESRLAPFRETKRKEEEARRAAEAARKAAEERERLAKEERTRVAEQERQAKEAAAKAAAAAKVAAAARVASEAAATDSLPPALDITKPALPPPVPTGATMLPAAPAGALPPPLPPSTDTVSASPTNVLTMPPPLPDDNSSALPPPPNSSADDATPALPSSMTPRPDMSPAMAGLVAAIAATNTPSATPPPLHSSRSEPTLAGLPPSSAVPAPLPGATLRGGLPSASTVPPPLSSTQSTSVAGSLARGTGTLRKKRQGHSLRQKSGDYAMKQIRHRSLTGAMPAPGSAGGGPSTPRRGSAEQSSACVWRAHGSRVAGGLLASFRQKRVALALYDYTGQYLDADAALLFSKWDVVEIVESVSNDWWMGRRGESKGLLPSSYVQELPRPIKTVIAEYDFASTDEGYLSCTRGDEIVVVEAGAEWLWGYRAGVYGRVPVSHVYDSTVSGSSDPLPPTADASSVDKDMDSFFEAIGDTKEEPAAESPYASLPVFDNANLNVPEALVHTIAGKLVRVLGPSESRVSVLRGKDLMAAPEEGLTLYLFDDALFFARPSANGGGAFDHVACVPLKHARLIELSAGHMIGFQMELKARSLYTFLFASTEQKRTWSNDCKLAVRRWQAEQMEQAEASEAVDKTASVRGKFKSFWFKTRRGKSKRAQQDPAYDNDIASAMDVRNAMTMRLGALPSACRLFIEALPVAWQDIYMSLGVTYDDENKQAHLLAFSTIHAGCMNAMSFASGRQDIESTVTITQTRMRSRTISHAQRMGEF